MRYIRIVYTVRQEANLEEVKAAITAFVAAIAAHHPEHRYSSFQLIDNPREFIHVGELVEEAVADFQSRPFFHSFSEYLHEHCENSPKAMSLTRVASTLPANR
jgi:quinol monooxygenase YgiN